MIFDDGFKCHLKVARYLYSLGIPACFAVTVGWLNSRGFLSDSDVREIVGIGHEVCAHGVMHENILNLDEWETDYVLAESRQKLESITGKRVDCFVYPYGLYRRETLKYVRKHFLYARAINYHSNIIHHPFTDIISPYTFGAIEFFSIESINNLMMNPSKKTPIIILKALKGEPLILFTHECSIKTLNTLIKTLRLLGYRFTTLKELYLNYFQ